MKTQFGFKESTLQCSAQPSSLFHLVNIQRPHHTLNVVMRLQRALGEGRLVEILHIYTHTPDRTFSSVMGLNFDLL